jgi:hypothetical protein
MLNQPFFSEGFPCKFEQVTQQLKIDVPVLVSFQKSWHEETITDKFHPSKAEPCIVKRINLVELPGQNKIK